MTKRFSKTKKDNQGNNVAVGNLETWVQKSIGDGEFNFEKLWVREFKSQAHSIHWCPEMNYLVIGLEDGSVVPIEIDSSNPIKYTELRDYKVHKGKIIGLYIDPDRELCFTAGEDKYLRVFDFKSKQVINSKQPFSEDFQRRPDF